MYLWKANYIQLLDSVLENSMPNTVDLEDQNLPGMKLWSVIGMAKEYDKIASKLHLSKPMASKAGTVVNQCGKGHELIF